MSVNAHKKMKGLRTQNLRDHMTEAELIFTALAELSTRQIAETTVATGMAPLLKTWTVAPSWPTPCESRTTPDTAAVGAARHTIDAGNSIAATTIFIRKCCTVNTPCAPVAFSQNDGLPRRKPRLHLR